MENCAFCDRTQLEERVISETDDFYVIASLGQITDGGYTLLIPKEHVLCMAELDLQKTNLAVAMAIKIRNALSNKFRSNPFYKYPVTAFEHGIVGQSVQHAHLHFLPVVLDITTKVLADFKGCEMDEIPDYFFLRTLYKDRKEPYIFWTNSDGRGMICWNPPSPTQYFRNVVAEFLGCPERGNWRNMDPELDKKLWQETVLRLRPCF